MNLRIIFSLLIVAALCVGSAWAQDKNLLNATLKGKVRDDNGKSLSGVTVVLRQGETEIKTLTSDKNGEFTFENIKPGTYGLTLRKAKLTTATLEDIVLKAGDKVNLPDKLTMTINEGELALLRGSVFTAEGRSAAGIRVELQRVNADGSVKKLDDRVTGQYGMFAFRLPPDVGQYRVIAKIAGNPASETVNIDGAAIYRVAIQLPGGKK